MNADRKHQLGLVKAYSPMVRRIAFQILRRVPPNILESDLVGAGFEGLWDAIRRHGHRPREEFEKLAIFRVRGAILDELRRQDWMPRSALYRGLPRLDPVLLEDGIFEHGVPPEAEERAMVSEFRSHAAEAAASLPERERAIICEYYFGGIALQDIARSWRVTPARVAQLHRRAIEMMREKLSGKG